MEKSYLRTIYLLGDFIFLKFNCISCFAGRLIVIDVNIGSKQFRPSMSWLPSDRSIKLVILFTVGRSDDDDDDDDDDGW